jgi:site-specific DNA recombinase
MLDRHIAFYARVSSERQTRENTIASQITALRERIAADGGQLEPNDAYIDEGYSGSLLIRPALERLRDAVAAGSIAQLYVLAPDRLARRYALQALLMEECRRAGTEVVFLNRAISGTAEDDLLLQMQGVIAEYERAKILERSRRGRRHAARSGLLSAFTTAPFGYRYVPKDQGGGLARFEVVAHEAEVVRLVFGWIAHDRLSLREVCRRLQEARVQSRKGQPIWYASTLRGMLVNTAYIGRAVYGHSRYLPARLRLRPLRGHPHPSARPSARVAVPREEWIEVPVPALVDAAVFEAAQAQLAENRQRKRDGLRGPHWLLQGLTVCRRCGYAFYGKTIPRSSKDRSKGEYRLYRCIGADGYRYGGTPMCSNRSLRADHLEQAVWDRVCALLEQPARLADEYRRRLQEAGDNRAKMDELNQLERQISALQRGIGRLIDSYAAGVIERAEFEPRIVGMKSRVAELQTQQRATAEAAQAERELTLVIGQVEDFAARVRHNLDSLDWLNTREIIRTLVRRIEIDSDHVEMVFRVPPPAGGGGPDRPFNGLNDDRSSAWQHCTAGRRANTRLAGTLSSFGKGLGMPEPRGARLSCARLHSSDGQAARSELNDPGQTLRDLVPVSFSVRLFETTALISYTTAVRFAEPNAPGSI